MQESVDDALAQGAVVVVAAGNESERRSISRPANCSGVITVGAHGPQRRPHELFQLRPPHRHHGARRRLPVIDLIVGLGNDGHDDSRRTSTTCSIAARASRRRWSRARSRSCWRATRMLTGGRVLDLLTGTAREFGQPARHATRPFLLRRGDARCRRGRRQHDPGRLGTARTRFASSSTTAPTSTTTSSPPTRPRSPSTSTRSCRARSSGRGCTSTRTPTARWRRPDSQPVCRFYAGAAVFIDSHYYSADANECIAVLLNWPGVWTLETASAFYIRCRTAKGNCPAEHAAGLSLLQQPARRQPALHGRLVGAPRDAEPRLGLRRQGRRTASRSARRSSGAVTDSQRASTARGRRRRPCGRAPPTP